MESKKKKKNPPKFNLGLRNLRNYTVIPKQTMLESPLLYKSLEKLRYYGSCSTNIQFQDKKDSRS